MKWWQSVPHRVLHTTSVCVAEIELGVERLPDGRRKESLRTALSDVFGAFSDEILSFDRPAALEYARLVVERSDKGRPIDGFDAQIAAICRVHGATLVTRNVRDFESTGIDVLNPWEPSILS